RPQARRQRRWRGSGSASQILSMRIDPWLDTPSHGRGLFHCPSQLGTLAADSNPLTIKTVSRGGEIDARRSPGPVSPALPLPLAAQLIRPLAQGAPLLNLPASLCNEYGCAGKALAT